MRLVPSRAEVGAALFTLLLAAGAHAQQLQCDRCHGELELLRQRVSSLAEAQRLLAPAAVLHSSAHGKLSCTTCHTNIREYPHGKVDTRTCASCHAKQDTLWRRGVHANVRDREPVSCTSCHGVHDVASEARRATVAGIRELNARCTACHESQSLLRGNPHLGRALCSGCHGAHDIHEPDLDASMLHPLRQQQTCGACHDSIAAVWKHDVHADTLQRLIAAGATDVDAEGLPACTGCHGGHAMGRAANGEFAKIAVQRCAECHEGAAESFYESYHGQAVRLGSKAAAACADCHGAHGIRPSAEPASRTHEASLVRTCGACHPSVRASFVQYDPHPEPGNRERSPVVWFVFWAMNGLLVGTMLLWALHTGLWWLRLRGHGRGGNGESEQEG